ncbi:MAG: S-layer homology domain-containing protein [Clostridia bacterium]|nr:S-layer homology domain-containing protein [Clostridia bacterium]
MHFDSTPDNFVFTISKSGTYYIDVTCYAENLSLYLLNQNGSKLWSTTHHYSHPSKSYEFTLEAGTYYFSVENYSYDTDATAEGTGEYNFRIYPEEEPEDKPTTPPPSDEVDSSEIFNDVPRNAWYKIYIDFSITINIFTGTSATTFSPDMSMNRAMLVTVLWRLEGSPTVNCKLPFSDVNSSTWYTDAVKWAYSYGIVKGTSNTTFSPDMNITREQIATILYRYASETKSLNLNERNNLYSFPDGYKTNDFAWEALSWATAVEIINGANYGNGVVLDPQGVATRAQVAKILTVFYNNYMI